jgi:hypothetical protein
MEAVYAAAQERLAQATADEPSLANDADVGGALGWASRRASKRRASYPFSSWSSKNAYFGANVTVGHNRTSHGCRAAFRSLREHRHLP